MPFATINGNRVYHEVHGDGPSTVVLSHGFAFDHEMWSHQVKALAEHHRVIVWDERGHGMTEATSPFTFWDSASDVVGLLDEVGAEQAVLVGHSQGGWLSVRTALSHPDRVSGLVLVDSVAQDLPAAGAEGFAQMADAWDLHGPVDDLTGALIGLQFPDDFDASGWVAKWRARPPATWRHAFGALVGRFTNPEEQLGDRIREIGCPLSVIHGSEDQVFSLELVRETVEQVANAGDITLIEGARHCPPLSHPEPVTEALLRIVTPARQDADRVAAG